MTRSQALLVDIGSTYTKVAAVDLKGASLVAQGKSVTTVEVDVTLGLQNALEAAGIDPGALRRFAPRLACSSAAGGLSLVAIGLVPELTAEAARRAALGAGAVVRKVYSYQITADEVAEIEAAAPDIILLAGGTDGGETATLLHNAVMLAGSNVRAPIVVAGNKSVGGRALDILRWEGKDARLTDNVMPRLNELNVQPAQQAIRQVFLEQIVEAKGLHRVQEMLDAVAMPTPSAVLAAARLLADGTGQEQGGGELIVIDVGGATTDVHSVAQGGPRRADIIYRGLPEPRLKRTVEGDLGLRVSAPSLLEAALHSGVEIGLDQNPGLDPAALVEAFSQNPGYVAQSESEQTLEARLGRAAVRLALGRHAGRLQELLTPQGPRFIQQGKDLTEVSTVIGTGGIFAHHPEAGGMLRGALENRNPMLLSPSDATLYIDQRYILWATGLLSDHEPEVALRLLKRKLVREEG